ncbi:MAG: prolipoprotein diacylglyceryl transferase [Opitutales bacterium]
MLAYWVHNLDPFLIKFPPPWPIDGIRWYGFAYFLAFWLAYLFLKQLGNKGLIKLSYEQQQTYLFALFCGILLGGRLGYVLFYQFDYYWENLFEIVAIWHGGMSSHGGFIGITLALYWLSRKQKYALFSLTDLTVWLGSLGIFFGRCANFINAEVIGKPTQMAWGILYNGELFARHPSQLYEALGEGLLIFILATYSIFKKKTVIHSPGKLSCNFLIFYGIMRCFLERFREPDAPLICNLSRGQFYSIFVILVGALLKLYVKKHPISQNRCIFKSWT